MAMRQDGLKPEQRARLTFQLVRSDNDWPSTTFDVVSLTDVLHHERPERRTALFDTAASRVRPGEFSFTRTCAAARSGGRC